MFLKSLEMHGFKSFPDKIKLNFNRGLTAVVGPNGSGKSNVSDAIRWVLGEQSTKTLRGAKMEDVIFLGTQKRKSQGFAEVSLTIDNTSRDLGVDSDIVTITRKYDRSGDSEYKINGTNVRLKDINELFMDTGLGRDGYSMIGQGRIAEIVSAKSNERREIFEEASGITKYRYRKNESERKLAQAEDNLTRLRDILAELEGRVEPLRIQSEKAHQFLELAQQRKEMEISLWVHNLEKFKQTLRDEENNITVLQLEHKGLEKEYENLECGLEDTFANMQKCLAQIDDLRREKESLEAKDNENNATIAVKRNDILHNNENIERIHQEIAALEQSGLQQVAAAEQKRADIESLTARIAQIEAEIEQKQQALLELNTQNASFSDQVTTLNTQLNELTLRQSQAQMKISSYRVTFAELQSNLQATLTALEQKQHESDELSAEKAQLIEAIEAAQDKQESLENAQRGYGLKLQARSEKLQAAKADSEQALLNIREKEQKIKLLQDLDANMEGFAHSVKTVLQFAANHQLNGVLGTVSQLISVPANYTVAIETALGGAISHIVVQNDTTAKQAIKLLKEKNSGRATFLPLNTVKGSRLEQRGLDKEEGYIGLGCELVEYDAKYESILTSLLGRIVIAEDLDYANQIAKKYGYKFRIVTLDGQVINAGGSFTGGSQTKSQGVLSRKNTIETLQAQLKNQIAQRETSDVKLRQIQAEVDKLTAQQTAIQSELVVLAQDSIRFESEKKRLEHAESVVTEQLKQAQSAADSYRARMQEETAQKNEADGLIGTLQAQIDTLQTQINSVEYSHKDLQSTRETISAALSELSVQKAVSVQEKGTLEQSITALQQQHSQSGEMVGLLQQQIETLTENNAHLQQQINNLQAQNEQSAQTCLDIAQRIQTITDNRTALEASTSGQRAQIKEISIKRENIGRELAKLEEKRLNVQKEYDDIIAKLWEEYQLTRSGAEELAYEVEEPIKLRAKLNEVRGKIKSLGNINVEAIDEYKEVKERYEFMSAQITDVEKSKAELLKLIEDLTKNMYEIFSENFVKINHNFNEVFVDLFGGGKAELVLTDPDNVLESGIEIKVAPPGKIIKHLSALSGGEQAFIAIAIYFAILKIRPAPFCVLDEIEAALDDVNVNKYAQYLKNMTDKTQFILITHRRGTMESADILYGVTMQEEGVSKLLQLDVSEVESRFNLGQGN